MCFSAGAAARSTRQEAAVSERILVQVRMALGLVHLRFLIKEPLNNSARSAFQSEKPQIVCRDTSDSSRRYGRVAQQTRWALSGETHMGRAFAGHPPRFDSLIWNDQTTLAEAAPADPAKTPSRPCRVIQRFLNACGRLVELAHAEDRNAGVPTGIRRTPPVSWSGAPE